MSEERERIILRKEYSDYVERELPRVPKEVERILRWDEWLREQLTTLRADLQRVTAERDALKEAIRDIWQWRRQPSDLLGIWEDGVCPILDKFPEYDPDALAAVKPEKSLDELRTRKDFEEYVPPPMTREEDSAVRLFIAMNHEDGKCHIYGDDGELQCSNIARHGRTIDFRREPISDLLQIVQQTRMQEYAEAQKTVKPETCPCGNMRGETWTDQDGKTLCYRCGLPIEQKEV